MGSQMRSGASAAACSTLTNKASGSDTLMLGIMKLQERLEHKSRFLKRGQALPGHRETRFAESQELPGSAAAPGAGSHQPPLIHAYSIHSQGGNACIPHPLPHSLPSFGRLRLDQRGQAAKFWEGRQRCFSQELQKAQSWSLTPQGPWGHRGGTQGGTQDSAHMGGWH